MKTRFDRFLTIFRGRRAYLPLLAATSLLAVALFSIFPSAPLVPRTGGGTSREKTATRVSTAAVAVRTSSERYVSLNMGETVDLSPGPVTFGRYPRIIRRIPLTWSFRAVETGHTVVTVGHGRSRRTVYVFVSPIPSRNVTREDVDWYKTQYGTGTANCGPALVAMALLWARGIDMSVQAVRDEIGWPYPDGATSFDDLEAALRRHRVATRTPEMANPRDLMAVVDRGHIALVLIQSGAIPKVSGDPSIDLVGRYYDDDEGHYVVVKGYSLDHGYFIIYDPYPVDWESNSLRYADDVSMIGKNRFYPAERLFAAMKTRTVIEVSPGPAAK